MKNNTTGSSVKLPLVWQNKIDKIVGAVVEEFGYDDESQVWERSKVPHRCWARWIAWFHMKKIGMSIPQISRYSKRDYGAVMHGLNRFYFELGSNRVFSTMSDSVSSSVNDQA